MMNVLVLVLEELLGFPARVLPHPAVGRCYCRGRVVLRLSRRGRVFAFVGAGHGLAGRRCRLVTAVGEKVVERAAAGGGSGLLVFADALGEQGIHHALGLFGPESFRVRI